MRSSSAPPFLLAAALLFWSAMTGEWLIGLSLAVIVELAHWIRLRWDFADAAFLRAWHLSVLLVAARMVLTVLQGSPTQVIQELVVWSPALFFPIQFAQSYGLKDKMPLYTFSILARKRWERNRALGIGGKPVEASFDYIYLGITLLAAALGKQNTTQSLVMLLGGFILLSGWALLASGHRRKFALFVCLALAGAVSVGGMVGLKTLYRIAIGAKMGGGSNGDVVNYTDTNIGKLGELKQSTEILWRIKTLKGTTPPLLHLSVYNQYNNGTWSWRPAVMAKGKREMSVVPNKEPTPGHTVYFASADREGPEAMADHLPRINLRGAAKEKMLLPVPGNLTSLADFEFDYVERTPLGSFRAEPKEPIINGTLIWDPKVSPDSPPEKESPNRLTQDGVPEKGADLKIPDQELAAVHETAEKLALKGLPLSEQLTALRNLFMEDFRYTRYLSISAYKADYKSSGSLAPSAITQFLTTNHAGHCEYFATAATLILRDAGIPTRYAVGFSVQELDLARKEAVLRGTHAHAWCRVWDADSGTWIDFDPTPPNWLALEPDRRTWLQYAQDWLQLFREDFFIWRNDPGNTSMIGLAMGTFGLLGAAAIGRNLWKSRRQIEKKPSSGVPPAPAVRTPLHSLEPVAKKLLGARPLGMTYPRWLEGLRVHLTDPQPLAEAIGLHQRLRFDSQLASDEASARLETLEQSLKSELKSRSRKPR